MAVQYTYGCTIEDSEATTRPEMDYVSEFIADLENVDVRILSERPDIDDDVDTTIWGDRSRKVLAAALRKVLQPH